MNSKYIPVDGGERIAHELISKLKFISKIKKDDVVDIRTKTIQANVWSTRLYRSLLRFLSINESRENTMKFIHESYTEAFELADKYISSGRGVHNQLPENNFHKKTVTPIPENIFHLEIGNLIISSIKDSLIGLDNLKCTYSTDSMFVSEVETLTKTIEARLRNMEK